MVGDCVCVSWVSSNSAVTHWSCSIFIHIILLFVHSSTKKSTVHCCFLLLLSLFWKTLHVHLVRRSYTCTNENTYETKHKREKRLCTMHSTHTHARSAQRVWQRHSRELIASVVCLISIYSFPYHALASYDRSSAQLIHSFLSYLSLSLSISQQ